MELDEVNALDGETVELYRVNWHPDPLLVQSRSGLALVAMVRRSPGGGVLLALPASLVPAGSLPLEPDGAGTIGLHTRIEVAGVRLLEEGTEELGVDLDVRLVDIGTCSFDSFGPCSRNRRWGHHWFWRT